MNRLMTTLAAVLLFCVLYSPQPLLAHFAQDFKLQPAAAGALMTASLIPLALAPLLYGMLLHQMAGSKLLRLAMIGMSISCLLFAAASQFWQLLALRFVQGLLLPAAITAITSDIATTSSAQNLQRNMSIYITGTILGGLFGRLFAGLIASFWHWQAFYYLLASALLLLAANIKTQRNHQMNSALLRLSNIGAIVANPSLLKIYLSVFCMFFSFVAVLNYLPFIISSVYHHASEALIALMYSGFMMGAVCALGARQIRLKFGAKRSMLLAFLVFIGALMLLFSDHLALLFALVFAFCAGNFLLHSIAATEVNNLTTADKNLVNALYVSSYYGGGVFSSYFAGLVWQHFGKQGFIEMLLAVSAVGALALISIKNDRFA